MCRTTVTAGTCCTGQRRAAWTRAASTIINHVSALVPCPVHPDTEALQVSLRWPTPCKRRPLRQQSYAQAWKQQSDWETGWQADKKTFRNIQAGRQASWLAGWHLHVSWLLIIRCQAHHWCLQSICQKARKCQWRSSRKKGRQRASFWLKVN